MTHEDAAVDAGVAEIYVNPFAPLSDEEWRFVLAHETRIASNFVCQFSAAPFT